ncbi:MAG: hypothetical protein KGJ57_18785 [Sphingomonadales bacterium]|nr:hypothetical protein [Sphingomonadales bacterium]MDE2171443.1 hypothetical protein [Sphingomonadales bacterium]
MPAILLNVFGTMLLAGGIALAAASLSWFALSWSRRPGLGPIAIFVLEITLLRVGDLDRVIQTFGGVLALVGLASLFGDRPHGIARRKP